MMLERGSLWVGMLMLTWMLLCVVYVQYRLSDSFEELALLKLSSNHTFGHILESQQEAFSKAVLAVIASDQSLSFGPMRDAIREMRDNLQRNEEKLNSRVDFMDANVEAVNRMRMNLLDCDDPYAYENSLLWSQLADFKTWKALPTVKRMILFSYLPLTGGSIFEPALEAFADQSGLPVYHQKDRSIELDWNMYDSHSFWTDNYLIFGHIPLYTTHLQRRTAVILLLRDPVERIQSLVTFIRKWEDTKRSVEDIIDDPSFINVQTSFFSKDQNASHAMEMLDKYVTFFGLYSDLDVAMCTIGNLFDLPCLNHISAFHPHPPPMGETTLTPKQLAFFRQKNSADVALYRYALDRYAAQDVPHFLECQLYWQSAQQFKPRDQAKQYFMDDWCKDGETEIGGAGLKEVLRLQNLQKDENEEDTPKNQEEGLTVDDV